MILKTTSGGRRCANTMIRLMEASRNTRRENVHSNISIWTRNFWKRLRLDFLLRNWTTKAACRAAFVLIRWKARAGAGCSGTTFWKLRLDKLLVERIGVVARTRAGAISLARCWSRPEGCQGGGGGRQFRDPLARASLDVIVWTET